MKFVEYQDVSRNRIRNTESNKVLVNANWHSFPCAIAPHAIVDNWQMTNDAIHIDDMQSLQKQYQADLIIIGYESEPKWDTNWLKLQAQMHQLGMGIEQMHRDAAIRTFNVLTTEERPVWLVLL
jgi:uncharacterized protein